MPPDRHEVPPAVAHLIRTIGGIETPHPGRWSIAAGPPVAIEMTRRWRRRRSVGRVHGGALVINEDVMASTLSLVITQEEPGREQRIEFEGQLHGADPSGRWQFSGRMQIGTSCAPSTVDAYYRGVYRSGAHPVAWLALHGHTHSSSGPTPATMMRLSWVTDVNADAPAGAR
jgi:hypothetical protein